MVRFKASAPSSRAPVSSVGVQKKSGRRASALSNQLHIDMNTSTIQPSDLQMPKVVEAEDGRKILPFYTARYCFSNHFPVDFQYDGHDFHTSEQAFMYAKAKQFGDDDAKEKILAEWDPRACKSLGRAVRNFDEAVWTRVSYDTMLSVLRAKFSQHTALRNFLTNTVDAMIVEAAPRDRIWGIGMGENNPQVADPSKHRGRNLLGKALMEIREEFRVADGMVKSS
ncbi:NADAR family protein [Aphelenchoides fujianensis]|nr:NADAR family protein [Aphelenchoides fujianensis]